MVDEHRALLANLLGARQGIFDWSNLKIAGLHAEGLEIVGANLHGAQLNQCRLRAMALSRCNFDACLMAECDFERSNLERSSWAGAIVVRSRLGSTMMVDAILDRVLFIECDLRGADLSVQKLGSRATMIGARFVRCDLRETKWDGRMLSEVRISECKLHGVHGRVVLDATEIDGTDLSAKGDGSRVASATELLAAWKLCG